AQQLAGGMAAQIHEGERLGEQRACLAQISHLRHLGFGRRRIEPCAVPPRHLVQNLEADIVPRVPVLLARIPEAHNQLHIESRIPSPESRPYFFSLSLLPAGAGAAAAGAAAASSPSSSFFPFLMTSGSA